MTDLTPHAKALVVEDNKSISHVLTFILEREGFEVVLAEDGKVAMNTIENESAFTLALVDLMLPFYDGFQIIERIRQTKTWKEVPIIILSGKTKEMDIVKALKAGADDYVIKPFQPGELVARIHRFS